MGNFGFVSTLLKINPRNPLWKIVPEKWRYWRGPFRIGGITGLFPEAQLQGWGWKLPEEPNQTWSKIKINNLWPRFLGELAEQEVKIFGMDSGINFSPPPTLRNQATFPGISDGRALELLLFVNRFRNILNNYGIATQKAKATVIWEEGNLGVTCARLIAREVRFLTLISPNERLLERAADLVYAETGISPQIYSQPPLNLGGAKIVIKCGQLSKLQFIRSSKRILWYELFQKCPSLPSLNVDLPMMVRDKSGELPLYPALGEAMLRLYFDLNYGYWYGPELPLERVIKLAVCFRELGREIAV